MNKNEFLSAVEEIVDEGKTYKKKLELVNTLYIRCSRMTQKQFKSLFEELNHDIFMLSSHINTYSTIDSCLKNCDAVSTITSVIADKFLDYRFALSDSQKLIADAVPDLKHQLDITGLAFNYIRKIEDAARYGDKTVELLGV